MNIFKAFMVMMF